MPNGICLTGFPGDVPPGREFKGSALKVSCFEQITINKEDKQQWEKH